LSCRPFRTSCWIVGTTSPVSVCRWVQLTWNVADPRGRVCRIRRLPAARRKGRELRWPLVTRRTVHRHAQEPGHTPGTRSERTYLIRCGQNKWRPGAPECDGCQVPAHRTIFESALRTRRRHPARPRQPGGARQGRRARFSWPCGVCLPLIAAVGSSLALFAPQPHLGRYRGSRTHQARARYRLRPAALEARGPAGDTRTPQGGHPVTGWPPFMLLAYWLYGP
jgi:hypothetical protein